MTSSSVPFLAAHELRALARLARAMRVRSTGPLGQRLQAVCGRGSALLGHDRWRDGEDPKNLDWGARLRTGQLWVRRFHAEGEPRTRILLDASASMGEGKLKAALRLAAATAFLAVLARRPFVIDRLGDTKSLSMWHGTEDWLGGLAAGLARVEPTAEQDLPAAITTSIGRAGAADEILLISDWAAPYPPARLLSLLGSARARGLVAAVQVFEARDEELPPEAAELVAPELGGECSITPDASSRRQFGDAVRAARQDLATEAPRYGVRWCAVDAHAIANVADTMRLVWDVPSPQRTRAVPS